MYYQGVHNLMLLFETLANKGLKKTNELLI